MPNIYEIACQPDIKHQIILNRIAKRLHDERKAHGYNQEELGNELSCSRQRVASWEVGWNKEGLYPKHLPEIDHLIKLCSLYNCDPGYLLCEYDERHKTHYDVSCVTGLTPSASSVLVDLLLQAIDKRSMPINVEPPVYLLAFINHLLENITVVQDALTSFIYISSIKERYDQDPYKEIINDIFVEKGDYLISRVNNPKELFFDLSEEFMNIVYETLTEHYDFSSTDAYIEAAEARDYIYLFDKRIMSGFHRDTVAFATNGIVESFINSYDSQISTYKSFLAKGQKHDSFIHKQQFDEWPYYKNMRQADMKAEETENAGSGYEVPFKLRER